MFISGLPGRQATPTWMIRTRWRLAAASRGGEHLGSGVDRGARDGWPVGLPMSGPVALRVDAVVLEIEASSVARVVSSSSSRSPKAEWVVGTVRRIAIQ
jgi:hypothetical protein